MTENELKNNPAGNYMFKVINRNTRKRCEICSKVKNKITRTTPMASSGVFIVNFEHISHLVLRFLFVNFEQVNASWET